MRTLFLLAGFAIVSACHRSPPSRPPIEASLPAEPADATWPRTVAEAVSLELRTMSDAEKAALRSVSRDRVQDAYHGFQMMHRAHFGLGEGNDDLLASCGSVRMTAEDCMRNLLDALWVALQGDSPDTTPP